MWQVIFSWPYPLLLSESEYEFYGMDFIMHVLWILRVELLRFVVPKLKSEKSLYLILAQSCQHFVCIQVKAQECIVGDILLETFIVLNVWYSVTSQTFWWNVTKWTTEVSHIDILWHALGFTCTYWLTGLLLRPCSILLHFTTPTEYSISVFSVFSVGLSCVFTRELGTPPPPSSITLANTLCIKE